MIWQDGIGPLRPRLLNVHKEDVAATAATELVAGVAGKRIIVTHLCISNGGANLNKCSIRWGSSGADKYTFHLMAEGGGVALSLLQNEGDIGAAGEGVYAKQSDAGTVAYTVTYYIE